MCFDVLPFFSGAVLSGESLIALLGFAFVTSVSPGPGNFLLLTSGANFGFIRSLPLIFGISLGFLSMVLMVGLGFGEILDRFPLIYSALKYTCLGYILWLAWKIANSRSLGKSDPEKEPNTNSKRSTEKPIGFVAAAFLQLLNPKAWAVSLVVTVTYTNSDNYLLSLWLLTLCFAFVNLPSISLWAISGTAMRNFLGKGNRIIIFNRGMALLLIISMTPLLFNSS